MCLTKATRTIFSNIIITTISQLDQLTTVEYAPRIDTFRTEIDAFVCIHDCKLDWSLFWPYQRQHASNANQTTCHTSLKATHKEVYSFLDISQCLRAEQLTDDWDHLINLTHKCQGVLQSQIYNTIHFMAHFSKAKHKTTSTADWHFRNSTKPTTQAQKTMY